MSLINDALNKVQRERREAAATGSEQRYLAEVAAEKKAKATGRNRPVMWVLINAGVLILVLAGNHFFFRDSPSVEQPVTILPTTPSPASTVAASPVPFARPIAPAPRDELRESPISASPFITLPSQAPSPTTAAEVEYDLAGMTVVGKDTLLSIIRRSDQRSIWVPVGKTVGEVSAVSYNAENDDAIIRVRGQTMRIGMRNAAVYFRPVTPPTR